MNLDRLFNKKHFPDLNPFFHSVPVNSSVLKIVSSNISTLKPTEGSLNRLNCNEGCCSLICQKIAKIWKAFCGSISNCFSSIYRYISSFFVTPYPTINTNMSKEALQKIYWGLGKENKWREYIDGRYHHLGKDVFDKGLHGSTIEPGYVASMEKACAFIEQSLNKKIDADWYLKLHKITCGHFSADLVRRDAVLMGQEKVGVFRNSDDAGGHGGHYEIPKEVKAEVEALDKELKNEFGPTYGMGNVTYDDPYGFGMTACIYFKPMSRYQVRRIFDKFLNEFYKEVEKARSPDEKLMAIAKFIQRLEWFHPTKDGSGRTIIALLNKLLVEYGFHPTILEYPFKSNSSTFASVEKLHTTRYDQVGTAAN